MVDRDRNKYSTDYVMNTSKVLEGISYTCKNTIFIC